MKTKSIKNGKRIWALKYARHAVYCWSIIIISSITVIMYHFYFRLPFLTLFHAYTLARLMWVNKAERVQRDETKHRRSKHRKRENVEISQHRCLITIMEFTSCVNECYLSCHRWRSDMWLKSPQAQLKNFSLFTSVISHGQQ